MMAPDPLATARLRARVDDEMTIEYAGVDLMQMIQDDITTAWERAVDKMWDEIMWGPDVEAHKGIATPSTGRAELDSRAAAARDVSAIRRAAPAPSWREQPIQTNGVGQWLTGSDPEVGNRAHRRRLAKEAKRAGVTAQ